MIEAQPTEERDVHWSKYVAIAAIAGTIIPLGFVSGLVIGWRSGNMIVGLVLMAILGTLALVLVSRLCKK